MRERRGQSGFSGPRGEDRKRNRPAGTKDGSLLAYAQDSFDVFVTIDRKLERQHDLKKLRMGVVVARVPRNEIVAYRPIFAALLAAATRVKAGEIIHVESSTL